MRFCGKQLINKSILFLILFLPLFAEAQQADTNCSAILLFNKDTIYARHIKTTTQYVYYTDCKTGKEGLVKRIKVYKVLNGDNSFVIITNPADTLPLPLSQPPAHYWNDQLLINAGIGYSAAINQVIYWRNTKGDNGSSYPYISSPAYNLMIDYLPSYQVTSIGIAIGFNKIKGIVSGTANTPEILTRLNVAFRILRHSKIQDMYKNDFYYGLRIGISAWTDMAPPNTPENNPNQSPYYGPIDGSEPFEMVSIQLVIGLRVYASYRFAFHLEGGIGTPYVVEGGLTCRLGPAPDKKP